MSEQHNGNGHAQAPGATTSLPSITITVIDPVNMLLAVSGAYPTLDYALNMLDQARRELEAQWRLARAALYQQQQLRAAQDEQIRRELQKGR